MSTRVSDAAPTIDDPGSAVSSLPGWPADWQRTEVRATAPNEQIFLTLVGDHSLRVEFAPGYYQRVAADQLTESFTKAVKLLVIARTRAFYDARSRELGRRVEPGREVVDDDDRRYRERLAELHAEGVSPDGRLQLVGVGLTTFLVRIAPGTLTSLDEASFCHQAEAAGLAFLTDHLRAFAQLRYDVYFRPFFESAGQSASWTQVTAGWSPTPAAR